MRWFKNKREETEQQHDGRVEVSINKKAVVEAAQEAKAANNLVYNLIESNNFHVVLFKAAGGKIKRKRA